MAQCFESVALSRQRGEDRFECCYGLGAIAAAVVHQHDATGLYTVHDAADNCIDAWVLPVVRIDVPHDDAVAEFLCESICVGVGGTVGWAQTWSRI